MSRWVPHDSLVPPHHQDAPATMVNAWSLAHAPACCGQDVVGAAPRCHPRAVAGSQGHPMRGVPLILHHIQLRLCCVRTNHARVSELSGDATAGTCPLYVVASWLVMSEPLSRRASSPSLVALAVRAAVVDGDVWLVVSCPRICVAPHACGPTTPPTHPGGCLAACVAAWCVWMCPCCSTPRLREAWVAPGCCTHRERAAVVGATVVGGGVGRWRHRSCVDGWLLVRTATMLAGDGRHPGAGMLPSCAATWWGRGVAPPTLPRGASSTHAPVRVWRAATTAVASHAPPLCGECAPLVRRVLRMRCRAAAVWCMRCWWSRCPLAGLATYVLYPAAPAGRPGRRRRRGVPAQRRRLGRARAAAGRGPAARRAGRR